MQNSQFRSTNECLWGILLLLLLTVVAYSPAVHGGFIWDDDMYITNNQFLWMRDGLKHIWLNPDSAHQYYPFTVSTFWLEFRLWGLWPTGYHLTNIMLHASNAILLWAILRILLLPGAWFAAAIFALHPVHVESVAWIIERKNVLSGFFYFSALLCYLRFLARETDLVVTKSQVWGYYTAALVLFFCGLSSKTAICSLPVTILIVLWWKNGRLLKKDVIPLIPMFGLGLVMGLLTVMVEKSTVGAVGDAWSYSLVERILIASRALCFYAAKLLLPYNLAFIYPQWNVDASVWWQYSFSVGVVVFLVIVGCLQRRIGRAPLAATLFFCVTLGPALGFFDIYFMRFSFVANHFQYLASIGVIVPISGVLWWLPRLTPAQSQTDKVSQLLQLRLVLSFVLIVTLGILTWQHAHLYASPETLWLDTLKKNPTSWLAHNNLGISLLDKKEYMQAIHHFEEAVRLKPNLVEPRNNLVLAFLRTKDFDAAIQQGLEAIIFDPGSSRLHSMLGSAFWGKGDAQRAVVYFREAVRHEPVIPEAHYNLGVLYIKEQAFKNIPPKEGIAHLERALSLNPDSLQIRHTLAWALATYPDITIRDGQRAVALAREGCERTRYRNPILLDTLAAAYAEVGRFDDAVNTAHMAIDLSHQQKQEQLLSQIVSRLELYQSEKPYYDSFISRELGSTHS